jgi:chromosome segregation ATPase
MEDLSESNREREDLKQRLHDLEGKMTMLLAEKNNIAAEFEALQSQVGVKCAKRLFTLHGRCLAMTVDTK